MELEQLTDPARLRGVFGAFPSGVVAVCGLREGNPAGLAASSFTSVSLRPPLVSVCVQHTSATWPVLAGLPRIGVSVLAANQDALSAQLAREGDRFAGVGWTATEHGAVLLDGAAAWLECAPHEVVPAGDHDIVLLQVRAAATPPAADPLVFHASRYRLLAAS